MLFVLLNKTQINYEKAPQLPAYLIPFSFIIY